MFINLGATSTRRSIMRKTLLHHCRGTLLLAAIPMLLSCGGGSDSSGGGGGGAGITTISGNISEIVAETPPETNLTRNLLALLQELVLRPANAQESFADIQVIGGDRITVADASGNFILNNVTPSQNFILIFVLENNQSLALPIGEVPAGATVQVTDVVLNAGQGFASAGDVQVEEQTDTTSSTAEGSGPMDDANAEEENAAG